MNIETIYLMILLIVLSLGCKQKEYKITVKLQDYGYNTLPLPDEMKILDKVVKRNFVLKKNETSFVKAIDITAMMNGNLDTSFNYYPVTIKKGECTIENSTFQIGLVDENRNNSFTDFGIDRLIFLPANTDSIYYTPLMYAPITTLEESTIVEINGNLYSTQVSNEVIELSQEKDVSDSVKCVFNSIIPDIQVFDEQGNSRSLRDYKEKDKNLIVELWFNGCAGCIKTLPDIKKIDTEGNTIVSLNVIDELFIINHFKDKHSILWKMVKSDKSALNQLGNLGKYPSAVVYNKQGNLIHLSKKF